MLAIWFSGRQNGASQNIATVTLNGKTLYTIDLSTVTETETFVVGEEGAQNTIQVSPEGIGVIAADCPDQVCVRQGIRAHGPEPIVCLPHRMSISFSSNGTGDDALDAVTGQ